MLFLRYLLLRNSASSNKPPAQKKQPKPLDPISLPTDAAKEQQSEDFFEFNCLFFGLSISEKKLANAIRLGLRRKDIAKSLGISARTVDFHMANICKKLAIKKTNLVASRRIELLKKLTAKTENFR